MLITASTPLEQVLEKSSRSRTLLRSNLSGFPDLGGRRLPSSGIVSRTSFP